MAMKNSIFLKDRVAGAIFGMFIGDALAMPVHWYYNTQALRQDYGEVTDFLSPRNPHPDSILWRSSYIPSNKSSDILHDQAKYWGKKGIHYHQFLREGENTLNLKLARELLFLMQNDGGYATESWLEHMIVFLTTPGNHKDTYAEEYLRFFFSNYGKGKQADQCGNTNEKHIGGFSLMLPIILMFADRPKYATKLSLQHLSLTHGGSTMEKWGTLVAVTILNILGGESLRQSIAYGARESCLNVDIQLLEALSEYSDSTVVGKHFSSACYADQAVPATLYLALKYRDSPEKGLIANTMCGGDNAGRGAVLGALLGALHGTQGWPLKWMEGLLHPPPVAQLMPQ